MILARVSVLRDAATLGVLFLPAWRPRVNAMIEQNLVRARRPEPDVTAGQPGRWGVLSLTGLGVVVLRTEAAKLAGRQLPARLRQLSLFD